MAAERGSPDPAEEVFGAFLEQVEEGAEVDFDAVCERHPTEAPALRRMHRRWLAMSQAFAVLSQDGGAAGADAGSSESLTGLLQRLAGDRERWRRYALGAEIARGAMGRVVRAWDEELRRDVALKVQRSAADGRLQRRFVEEAQIAAQLDHPGIVPIHELGVDAEGRPFFAMKLVRGRDLGELLPLAAMEREGWSRTRVLHVLLRVCEAMAYAHDKGVVHRDLKPQNVMVGRFGETYVMDWGLARVVGRGDDGEAVLDTVRREIEREESVDDTDSPLLTRFGDVVGTPAYMAPEQADGEAAVAATAVDVYAIGAIVYHLLAGHAPYSDGSLTAQQIVDAVRRGPPPPLPSTVPGALRAICSRAMARSPAERYPSALALADDLRAWLEGRVVSAHRTGSLAELGKWIARNRALSISSLLLLIALLVGGSVATRLWLVADRARVAADANADRLAVELLHGTFRNARQAVRLDDSGRSATTLWRLHAEGAMPRATHWALVENTMLDPVLRSQPFEGGQAIARCPQRGAVLVADRHGLLHERSADDLGPMRVLGEAGAAIGALMVATDGTWAVTGNDDGEVVVWDLERGAERRRTRAHDARVTAAAQRSGGFVTGDADGLVRWWPTPDADPVLLMRAEYAVWKLEFDEPTQVLAVGCDRGLVELLQVGDGTRRQVRYGARPMAALAFSNDGALLWVGTGERIVAAEVATGGIVRRLPSRNGTCRDLAQLDDGTFAAGGWWRIDHLAADGAERTPFSLQGVLRFAVDPAGSSIAVVTTSSLSLVDTTSRDRRPVVGSGAIALSGDGRTAFTWHGGLAVLDVESGVERTRLQSMHGGWLRTDPTGAHLAAARTAKTWLLDVAGDEVLELRGADDVANDCIGFSPDGAELALIVGEDAVERRRTTDGALLWRHQVDDGPLQSLAWSPDGSRLVVVFRDATRVLMVSIGDGAVANVDFGTGGEAQQRITAAAFDGDSRQLAVGTFDGELLIRDLRTGSTRTIRAPSGLTWGIAFHPTDPGLLISSTGAGGLAFWDLDSGECCLQMLKDVAPIGQLQLSRDGRTLSCFTQRGPLLVDLAYRERHLAGNVATSLERLRRDGPVDEARAAALSAWAQQVLTHPWPRWR
ncbi:MAG: protein kinase [Planctomycetes bacterium]|nr:protein kinase [Planctomycetota bacterium]